MTRTRAVQCDGKRRYPDKGAAIGASIARRRRYGALRRHAEAYKCPHCGGWHLGHRGGR